MRLLPNDIHCKISCVSRIVQHPMSSALSLYASLMCWCHLINTISHIIVASGATPAAEAASAARDAECTAHDALCAGQCADWHTVPQ